MPLDNGHITSLHFNVTVFCKFLKKALLVNCFIYNLFQSQSVELMLSFSEDFMQSRFNFNLNLPSYKLVHQS